MIGSERARKDNARSTGTQGAVRPTPYPHQAVNNSVEIEVGWLAGRAAETVSPRWHKKFATCREQLFQ
jgi:hypothetical protein